VISELRWGREAVIQRASASLKARAIRVKHWGGRLRRDYYRGYNGYVLERDGRRIIFGGDTAQTDSFAELNDGRPFDLAIMAIGRVQSVDSIACFPGAGCRHVQ